MQHADREPNQTTYPSRRRSARWRLSDNESPSSITRILTGLLAATTLGSVILTSVSSEQAQIPQATSTSANDTLPGKTIRIEGTTEVIQRNPTPTDGPTPTARIAKRVIATQPPNFTATQAAVDLSFARREAATYTAELTKTAGPTPLPQERK